MKNSSDLGGCYPPRKASADNTLLDLQNFSYPTQPDSIVAKHLFSFFTKCLCWGFKLASKTVGVGLYEMTKDVGSADKLLFKMKTY